MNTIMFFNSVRCESILFFILLISALCVCGLCWPTKGLWKLDVIHYNDFHSRFEETSVESPFCRTNDALCLGGFPRLYAAIRSLLREKPAALLLNAGDSFQGTLWYTLLKWNITQQFMNLLPHDAHAIGNHEFDDGPAGLAPYLTRLKAPCLAANMDTSNEPLLQGLCLNSTVVTRNGRKIGIIGVITVSTALYATPGNTIFTDERLAAQREAEKLSNQGVDVIILLSHAGLDVDREIAAKYGENIDLIVGGHTHSLMWNEKVAPSGEVIADVYPVIVQPSKNSDHKVLIVQASAFTKYMGNLSVYFDSKGDYHSWEGGPIFLNRSYPEDETIKAMLEPYENQVHEAAAKVLGHSDVDLMKDECAFGECLLGDAICDGMIEHATKFHPTDLPTIAIVSQNTLYANIRKGPITFENIFEAFPYRDRSLLFKIKGKYVLQALELSFSDELKRSFKGVNLFQVADIRVKINVSMPVNKRVESAEVKKASGYQKLEDEEFVRVVAPAFLVTASGFNMFDNRLDTEVIGHDDDIFKEYLRAHDPVHPALEGRITITS